MVFVEALAEVASFFAVMCGLIQLVVNFAWWADFKHGTGITDTITRQYNATPTARFAGWSSAEWWQFIFGRNKMLLIACSVTANLVYIAGNDHANVYTGEPNLMPWLLILTGIYLVLCLVSKAMYMRLKLVEARNKSGSQHISTS